MDEIALHQKRVELIKAHLLAQINDSPLSLTLQKENSNTTNKKSYKNCKAKLDISSFCNVLKIDSEKKVALAEPKVSMYELAEKTFEAGFLPQVVPEFKSITVGGAISGGAFESSAHKYGLFHESCSSFDVLLGNGEAIKVSSEENRDLFFSLASSYGSLGIILQAEIKLISAPKSIRITYHPFRDVHEALTFIKERSLQKTPSEYLDGIIFSKDFAVIMEGDFSDQPQHTYLHTPLSPWFYQHVKEVASDKKKVVEYLNPLDYLFRYDQGAFWMGAYLLKPTLFMRLLNDGLLRTLTDKTLAPFTEKELQKFSQIHEKPGLLQAIFGPFMSSEKLYMLLHKVEKWTESKAIIQDFCIPFQEADHFLKAIQDTSGIYPLWLCPVKKSQNQELFSPNSTETKDSHYLNFGVYGLANRSLPTRDITKTLEEETKKLLGRKLLYTYTYYTKDEFWQIYPKKAYEELRKKYHAENTWLSIEQKMLG